MKFSIAAVIATVASVVSAQANIVSVTSPLTNTVYTAGQNATITWINPTVDVIPKIVLSQGNPSALLYVSTIAENVTAETGRYIWSIPADTPAGNDYALQLGVSPNISYTGLFTINAAQ
ncbi:hypothetical protein EDC96DRAFT_501802 [Choanephora cucurbitarum]|nr:hypothetical protein EDC96DRAFT_501802 [Choanephora cucurbitarum]